MATEANVMVGRLERNARMADSLATTARNGGAARLAGELENFADLFKLSASVIRGMAREIDTARLIEHGP